MDAAVHIEIRRATPADLKAIGLLGALLVRAHYEFDRDRFMCPGEDLDEGYAWFLSTQLEQPDALILVAEHHGDVVGYLYAAIEMRNWKELREEAGFVHDVFVDERSRGHRIADVLMHAAFDWMRDRRVPRVILWTASPNERARRLFDRLGFRSTMVEMTKELEGSGVVLPRGVNAES